MTNLFFVFWLQKYALLFCRDPISLCCNSLSFVLSKQTARTVKLGGKKAATYPRDHYCKSGPDSATGFFFDNSFWALSSKGSNHVERTQV